MTNTKDTVVEEVKCSHCGGEANISSIYGLCGGCMNYIRHIKKDTVVDERVMRMPLFLKKIQVEGECWMWTGAKQSDDYPRFFYKKADGSVEYMAYRASYIMFKGEIPKGYQIDHLCSKPSCVNPEHLEAVTPRENTLRSNGPSAINARKTHCKNGHEYTEENTWFEGNHRRCRVCDRERVSKNYWKNKSLLTPPNKETV